MSKPMHRVVSEYKLSNVESNIKVYVRARPLEDGTVPEDFLTVGADDPRQINIKDPDTSNRKYSEVSFQFDKIFWTDIGQEEIFKLMCKPQVEHVLQGFNTCCFAYGQTGSGKTYSMFGNDGEVRGIIPRSAEYLFSTLAKKSDQTETAVVCSFLEIYNDQVRDLGLAYLVSIGADSSDSTAIFNKTSDIFESLAGKRGNPYFAPAFYNSSPTKGGSKAEPAVRGLGYKEVQDEYKTMNMEIHEDGDGQVFVKHLSMVPVSTIDEVMKMISMGLKVRATHETKMNASSSRSHTVFTLQVLQRDKSTDVSITGMLNLVDLAGSERLKKSESQGVRLKEALHINTSLSALGKVIMSLDPSAESTHIPYRDAKLTRILQNSLGGNSYTVVLAAIHPSPAYYDECLSTLQFANRCRNVRNNPRVNYIDDPADKDSRIKRLQEEIVVLRTKISQNEKNPLSGGKGGGGMSAAKLVEALKKLGVSASLAADGAMIVNGERHELEDLGLEEEQEDEGSDEEGLSASQPGVKMSRKKLKRVYLELQDANRVHSLKSKERKVLMQEQGKQIQVLSMQVSRLALAVRRNDSEMMLQKDSTSLRALEEAKLINESHRREMDKLIEHHETANKRQMNVIQNAPNTFKTYTELVKQQGQLKDSYEEPLRKDFDVYMTKLSAAHEHEIGAQKKQYDFFLSEKDKSLIDFTEKFNAFRTKKTEQLRMCEQEIIKLFEYIEQIDLILDNVEKGVYKVEQKQGRFGKTILGTTGAIRKDSIPDHAGLLFSIAGNSVASAEYDDNVVNNGVKGRVLLPRGLRPYNPIREGGSNEMKLSQKIIANYNLRKGKFEQAQKYLDKKTATFTKNTLSTAAANRPESEGVDPLVEQHLRELLGPAGITANLFGTRTGTAKSGKRGAPLRPASAPATAIPKSLALASTHDKFHIVNKVSANSSEVDADRLGMKEPSSLRERRGMDSILSLHRTYSTSSVRDPSFILNPPNPGTRSPVSTSPLAHSSDGRIANWNVERKQNIFDRKNGTPVDRPGTGSSRGYDSSGFGFSNAGERDVASSDEVALLRAELLELKAQMKIDQHLITGISSNEMIQYIQKLEEENEDLHRKVRDIHSELRAIKVANIYAVQKNQGKTLKITNNVTAYQQ